MRLRYARTIAEEMRRRVVFIEEKNYMDAFTMNECVTDEEKVDREKVSLLTRAAYLNLLRECQNIIYTATSTTMTLTTISSNLSASESDIPKVCEQIHIGYTVLPPKRSE